MKASFLKHRKLWIAGIALVLILAIGIGIFAASRSGSRQVTNKIDVAQAQKIVDDTFGSLAKDTASGAKYILEASHVTVNSVSYGYEKDVILSCTYTALDVKGAMLDKVDPIMADVYAYYQGNEETGKKTNATKVNIEFKKTILEYLETAETISSDVTLYIYETVDGMKLYLSDESVDTVTGGLLSVSNVIKNTNSVSYKGETVDITNKNTLRTGVLDCIALQNYSSMKPSTGGPLEKAWDEFKDEFNRNFIEGDRYLYLVKGLGTTLSITALSALMGIGLGIIVALIRCTRQLTGKLKLPDLVCQFYLTVTRGTPVMVQLLILFFVFLLPLNVDKFAAAVICFGLNSGAYVAEIVRGGIMSVDKGQIEAGRSLGFNYVQTMVHFVIPQAFKAILPSLANEFITLLKESSVAFYIGIADLTQGGLKIRSVTYSNFMPLIAVALIYLALVMILTKLVGILERRLAKSDH